MRAGQEKKGRATRPKRFWETLAFLLMASSLIVWVLGYGGLQETYFDKLPRQPNAATGHVYPYNYHGIVLYETRDEQRRLEFMEYAAGFLSAAGVFIAIFKLKIGLKPDGPLTR